MTSDHIGIEHYEWVKRGEMTPGELLRRLYHHVLHRCPECRREWEALAAGQHAGFWQILVGGVEELPLDLIAPPPPPDRPERPSRYEAAFSVSAKRLTAAARAWRYDRQRARYEVARLLALPASERLDALRRARKRYRSPAFAHQLVEDARNRVRDTPREALAILALVRPTLEFVPGALGQDWAVALELRAEAHRANALRVAGDLHAADRQFREVRRRLAGAHLGDAAVEAEVASLEASLRRDQRLFEEAALLLDRAVLLYETEGDREGLARVLIQRAEIGQHFERHDAALADLERARTLVDPARQPFLHLCTVIAAVPTLLDLGRPREAEQVLESAEASAAAAEPWWRMRLRHLGGRAALAVGQIDRAARLLGEARDGFVAQDKPYDAAAASLDLALVALTQGRTERVRELTREIAPVFRGCGVAREALATLALFEQAKRADAAAWALAAELRRHLERAQASRAPQTPPS